MIKPIHWPEVELGGLGKYNSPFQRGERERSLKLTFHLSTLENISAEDNNALSVLYNLRNHEALDYLTIRFDDFPTSVPNFLSKEAVEAIFSSSTEKIPQMRIRTYGLEDEDVPIVFWDGKKKYGQSFISSPAELGILASHLVSIDDKANPKVRGMQDDLVIITALQQDKRDVLITTSPTLLSNKGQMIQEANPRTPTETARIVGLFLRSRNDFTIEKANRGSLGTNRGAFYWVLMRNKLPSMWRYYSACVISDDYRKDRTLQLGLSVLHRCSRALEARDAIAVGFYSLQNNDVRDSMTYHFDYLTLLLAGAFDALARVTHRAYKLTRLKENSPQLQFRKKEFLNELKSSGAEKLVEYVSQPMVQDLLEIVYNLRNTIHGANLTSLSYKPQKFKEEYSYITLSPELEKFMNEKILSICNPDTWGLVQFHILSFEPNTFATTLVNESFQIIDKIASETDIARLFPSNINMPNLLEGPPEYEFLFKESTRNIISVLG